MKNLRKNSKIMILRLNYKCIVMFFYPSKSTKAKTKKTDTYLKKVEQTRIKSNTSFIIYDPLLPNVLF